MGCCSSRMATDSQSQVVSLQDIPSTPVAASATTASSSQLNVGDAAVSQFAKLWSGVAREERTAWAEMLREAANNQPAPKPRNATTVNSLMVGQSVPPHEVLKLGIRQASVRLFLSSTFTDTELERNLLIDDVYPFLQKLGACVHVEVFPSSEMRWGIRSEASSSHQTSAICMEEIQRCQRESSGISYVLILGNKYGFRPFPANIPQTEYDILTQALTSEQGGDCPALRYMQDWYRLDTNCVPPTFNLKPVEKEQEGDWWSTVFPTIQSNLRAAVATDAVRDTLSKDRLDLYTQSVTAEEINNGLFHVNSDERSDTVHVFVREFDTVVKDDARSKLFFDMQGTDLDSDAQQRLEDLRAASVPAALGESSITRYTVPYEPEQGMSLDNPKHQEYLRTFSDDFCSRVAASILDVAARTAYEPDALVDEVAAHALLQTQRSDAFISTKGTDAIVSAVQAHADAVRSGSCKAAFVLCGESGTGKTSLMAHIAGSIGVPNAVRITRFLGTSRGSGTARALITSLVDQIQRVYKPEKQRLGDTTDMDVLAKRLAAAFRMATADKPLLLVLDSLDQLSDEGNGRNLAWLPFQSLPPNVVMVLSTLPKEGGCWDILSTALDPSFAGQVAKVETSDAAAIIDAWLSIAKRTLQPAQRELVLTAFEKCPTPLFLKLCVDFYALKWTSDKDVSGVMFPDNVPDLIDAIFEQLERQHGEVVVKAALGYLTASKGGLSDNEMQDVLSLNDECLDAVYEWWVPPVRRIPPLIWTRIVSDLPGALAERGVEGGISVLAWYHRQHREAAERRYLKGSLCQQRHGELAEYFSGKWAAGKPVTTKDKAGALVPRKVDPMALLRSGSLTDLTGDIHANARKLSVLPYHLLQSGDVASCARCVTDFDFVEAKIRAGLVFELADDLERAGSALDATETELAQAVDDYTYFVAQGTHVVLKNKASVFGMAQRMPDSSRVFKDVRQRIGAGDPRPVHQLLDKPKARDPNVGLLKGSRSTNTTLAFTRDSAYLLSGNERGQVFVFTTKSHTMVRMITLPGSGSVRGIVPLDTNTFACAQGESIFVFDYLTGNLMTQATVPSKTRVMAISDARTEFVLGSYDGEVYIVKVDDLSLVCTHVFGGSITGVDKVGTLVFAAAEKELGWFDVSDPSAWEKVSSHTLEQIDGRDQHVWHACFVPGSEGNETVVVTNHLHVVDSCKGTVVRSTKLSTMAYEVVVVKQQGRRLAALTMFDDTVTLIDLDSLEVVRKLGECPNGCIALSPDSRFVCSAGCNYYHVTMFDLSAVDVSPGAFVPPQPLRFTSVPAMFVPTGSDQPHFVYGGATSKLFVHNAVTLEPTNTFTLPDPGKAMLRQVVATSDGATFVCAAVSGDVVVLNGQTGEIMSPKVTTIKPVTHFIMSPTDDVVLGASDEGPMCIVNISNPTVPRLVFSSEECTDKTACHKHGINDCAWHPHFSKNAFRMFVTGSDDYTVRIWDADTGVSTQVLEGHTDNVTGVAMVGDDYVASVSEEDGMFIWSAREGTLLHRVQVTLDFPNSAVMNLVSMQAIPNSTLCVTASPNQALKIYDVSTGTLVNSVRVSTPRVLVSSDGKVLYYSSSGGVVACDAGDGHIITQYLGHDGTKGTGRFVLSPCGKYLLTKWSDKTIAVHTITS
eukprot:m.34089 g.34089  ORF g.34089 m.34089 type:complete len:1644 (+) comp9734_c0_seq1:164-5095(+)